MKCIYCGSEELSKSDIIPDALTNGKIINPCVCRVNHNNKFSDLFEDDVIKALAVFTNELDVKSSKGKGKYASYDSIIGIDGTNYKTKVSSNSDILSGKRIMRSEDGKTLIGPLDEIRKIKGAKEGDVKIVDLSEAVISQKVTLDFSIFFSESIYRLACKIAYEWFCLRNKIENRYDLFNDVISYIVDGKKSRAIVNIVSNTELYSYLNNLAGFGSHVLLSYVGEDGFIHVVVNLFGIIIYDITLCMKNDLCKNTALFQMVSLDAKQKWFSYADINEAVVNFNSSFRDVYIGSVTCKIPVDLTDDSLNEKYAYICIYDYLLHLNLTTDTKVILPILRNNVDDVLLASALTMRGLRRFIKEYREYIDSRQGLNPKATNKKEIFLFYTLYIVGKNDYINSLPDLNNYLRKNISEGDIPITEETTNSYLQEMIGSNDYLDRIIDGANKIEEWPM